MQARAHPGKRNCMVSGGQRTASGQAPMIGAAGCAASSFPCLLTFQTFLTHPHNNLLQGVLTPVKNQGSTCGSCWAFAAVEQIESDYAIASRRLLELSPQQLLATTYGWSGSPARNSMRDGCNGGFSEQAVAAAFAMGGVLNETMYPYEASATPVDDKVGAVLGMREKLVLRLDPNTALQLRSVTDVVSGANYKAGMIDMLHDGPVMLSLDASCLQEVRFGYKMSRDGPLTRELCDRYRTFQGWLGVPNHAVQVVAYNSERDYFVVRNSWDRYWGDGGFVSVKADACLIVSKDVWQTHMPVSPTPGPPACSCTWTLINHCPGSILGSVFGTSKNGWFCFSQCCPAAALSEVLTNMATSTSPSGLLPSPPYSSQKGTTVGLLVSAFGQADLDKLAEGLVTYFGKIDPTYLSWSNETEANWLTRLIHRDRRAQAIRANHLANSARLNLSGPGLIKSEGSWSRLVAQLREIALATADKGYESGVCDCTWTASWVCPSSKTATGMKTKGVRVAKDQTSAGHEDVCFYFCCGPDDDTARREARACIEQRNADAKEYYDSLHGILFFVIWVPIGIVFFLILVAFSLVTYPLRCLCDDEADVILLL